MAQDTGCKAVEERVLLVEALLFWPDRITIRRWDDQGRRLPDRDYVPAKQPDGREETA